MLGGRAVPTAPAAHDARVLCFVGLVGAAAQHVIVSGDSYKITEILEGERDEWGIRLWVGVGPEHEAACAAIRSSLNVR